MSYIATPFRIIFFGLALLGNSVSGHTNPIDLIELANAHNASIDKLPEAVIRKDKKAKKAQKKMSAIKKLYNKARLIAAAPGNYIFGEEPCVAKNVFYGIAGLASFLLAIYSYRYVLGIKLIQESRDQQKAVEGACEDPSESIVLIVEVSQENTVDQAAPCVKACVKEDSNHLADRGSINQVSIIECEDIVPVTQPVRNAKHFSDKKLKNKKSVEIVPLGDLNKSHSSELAPLDAIYDNKNSTILVDQELKPNTDFQLKHQELDASTDQKNTEKSAISKTDETVPAGCLDHDESNGESLSGRQLLNTFIDEKWKQKPDGKQKYQELGVSNDQRVTDASENVFISVFKNLYNMINIPAEEIYESLPLDESLVQQKIVELKWKDETTYEDWQEIIKLEAHLLELQKRNKAE